MRRNLPILALVCILSSTDLTAQKNSNNNINLYFARSFHGTGDLPGMNFSAEFGHFITDKLELSGNITSTIHWGAFGLFVITPNSSFDGSLRYTTAGIQAGNKLGYAILNLRNHMLKVQGGSFIRFQSSSYPGQYAITFPPAINYPEPVFTFRQNEKQNILTIGYVAELSYTYVTGRKLMVGAKAGLQNDTNADIITYYGIVIGKKLGSFR